MKFDVLRWNQKNKTINIIDQTLLPIEKKIIELKTTNDVFDAIYKLKVRGAPLIGIAAAFGAVIGYYETLNKLNIDKNISDISKSEIEYILNELKENYFKKIEYLKSSRPTAYNMFFLLNQMMQYFEDMIYRFKSSLNENSCANVKEFLNFLELIGINLQKKANYFQTEDAKLCEKIGDFGLTLIKDGYTILTHCNAGSLATSAWGTALAPIYKAFEKGLKIKVYADETRPLLQGARLTAYELSEKGIETYLICDNMAGYVMQLKKIDMVIVGADRICKNGDFANKIGTYSVAVLAKYHNIPFYVAAPYTTFDLNLKDGSQIPIEQRPKEEIIYGFGKQIAPTNINIFNPAFDVTPNELVTGYITDRGILKPPFNF